MNNVEFINYDTDRDYDKVSSGKSDPRRKESSRIKVSKLEKIKAKIKKLTLEGKIESQREKIGKIENKKNKILDEIENNENMSEYEKLYLNKKIEKLNLKINYLEIRENCLLSKQSKRIKIKGSVLGRLERIRNFSKKANDYWSKKFDMAEDINTESVSNMINDEFKNFEEKQQLSKAETNNDVVEMPIDINADNQSIVGAPEMNESIVDNIEMPTNNDIENENSFDINPEMNESIVDNMEIPKNNDIENENSFDINPEMNEATISSIEAEKYNDSKVEVESANINNDRETVVVTPTRESSYPQVSTLSNPEYVRSETEKLGQSVLNDMINDSKYADIELDTDSDEYKNDMEQAAGKAYKDSVIKKEEELQQKIDQLYNMCLCDAKLSEENEKKAKEAFKESIIIEQKRQEAEKKAKEAEEQAKIKENETVSQVLDNLNSLMNKNNTAIEEAMKRADSAKSKTKGFEKIPLTENSDLDMMLNESQISIEENNSKSM